LNLEALVVLAATTAAAVILIRIRVVITLPDDTGSLTG